MSWDMSSGFAKLQYQIGDELVQQEVGEKVSKLKSVYLPASLS